MNLSIDLLQDDNGDKDESFTNLSEADTPENFKKNNHQVSPEIKIQNIDNDFSNDSSKDKDYKLVITQNCLKEIYPIAVMVRTLRK